MEFGSPKKTALLVQMIRERDDKLRQAEEIMALDQHLLDAYDELVEEQKLQIQKLENELKTIKEEYKL